MRCPHFYPVALSLGLAVTTMIATAAEAQSSRLPPVDRSASNIDAADTRSTIAPALPIPRVPSGDPPFVFLEAARGAVQAGRTGEAQEGLERAETRILNELTPAIGSASVDGRRVISILDVAKRALASRDRPATIAAIDDALSVMGRGRVAGSLPPLASIDAAEAEQVASPRTAPLNNAVGAPAQVAPVSTQVMFPGHWKLVGATYEWVAPDTMLRPVQATALVPGRFVWVDGSYRWVPAHYTQ